MEAIESKYIQLTLSEDEVDTFKDILKKLKAESTKAGFKKTYNIDEQDIIHKLYTIVVEKKNY